MDTAYLREFVILGQSTSIIEASKTLALTPSTLSRHLAAIEDELGAKLIDRTTSSFQLTQEGEVFLEEAHKLSDLFSNAIDVTRNAKLLNPVRIVIGGHMRYMGIMSLITATASYLIRQNIPILLEPYEPHTFGLPHALSYNDPTRTAMSDLVNLSLLILCDNDDFEGYNVESIFHEPLSLLVPVDNGPLTNDEPVDLLDYKDRAFVSSPFYPSAMQSYVEICNAIGFQPTMRHRVFHSFGDVCSCHNKNEVILQGCHDAKRIAPPPLSGLIEHNIKNPEAFFDVKAVWKESANSSALESVVAALKTVSGMLASVPPTWNSTPS